MTKHWINGTKQEIFDHVVVKLAEQGRQSARSDPEVMNYCMYTDPAGRHCAAGWCMTPEGLAAVTEGRTLSALISSGPVPSPVEHPPWGLAFVAGLQAAHDGCIARAGLRGGLLDFATRFGLSSTVVETAMPDNWCEAGPWLRSDYEDK